jgi:hypothetical protein
MAIAIAVSTFASLIFLSPSATAQAPPPPDTQGGPTLVQPANPPQTGGDEEPSPGVVIATSYAPVPRGSSIAVRPLDNTPNNVRLKALFTEALAQRAYQVAGDGSPLALNFETEAQQLGRGVAGAGQLEIREINSDSPTRTQDIQTRRDESQFRIDIFASPGDGTRRGSRPGFAVGRLRYVLSATIDDQRTGQRLWQGEAIYDGFGAEEDVVLRALVPILSDEIGQTVRQRGFRLQ